MFHPPLEIQTRELDVDGSGRLWGVQWDELEYNVDVVVGIGANFLYWSTWRTKDWSVAASTRPRHEAVFLTVFSYILQY